MGILRDATEDPEAGPITVVLDALDECAESEFADLIRNVKSQFHLGYLSNKLKYLLTCRPYEQITLQFHSLLNSFLDIRIPGEEELEAIGQEINHVITHRINQLSAQKNLTPELKSSLTIRLQSIPHRTYLWVYLIFKHLEKGIYKKTKKGIESTAATLPSSINDAYESILNKSKERQTVQKALAIVLAATRPLTIAEMNVAINLVETSQNTYGLDLEDMESFKLRIRSLCGLFIAIHHNKVYLLHQTAREFLLTEITPPAASLPSSSWRRSISLRQAHTTLAELCVIYLDLFNSDIKFSKDIGEVRLNNSKFPYFLVYAAKNWAAHFNKADVGDSADVLPITMRICDPNSKSRPFWFRILQMDINHIRLDENTTELTLASYYGLTAVAKVCLEKGSNIEAADSDGYTPLWWAAAMGNEGTVKVLLERGADVEATNKKGETPLCQAAAVGFDRIVKMLLEKGAEIDAMNNNGETPLWRAASEGYEGVVKILLEKGADVKAKNYKGETLLWWAALGGYEGTVKMLLENGVDINATNNKGETPLCWAASQGLRRSVKRLLEIGADIQATDTEGRTPLWWATLGGHEAVVKLLREKKAELEAEGRHGP